MSLGDHGTSSGATGLPAPTTDEIEAVLLAYLVENFLPRGASVAISPDENLFESGVLDSAGLLECVLFIERRFGLTIPDEDLLPIHFSSVASVAAYLRYREALAGEGVLIEIRKCLVWDLDNTLWDGVCLEGEVRVPAESRHTLEELDARGILHSIASRGERDVSWKVLVENRLDAFFLSPRINWLPKPTNITAIARELGLALDAMAFVDDDPFEREQVEHMLPGVLVLDARSVGGLSERSEFCPDRATPESRGRRRLYRAEEARRRAETRYDTRAEFLQSCEMRLRVRPAEEGDVPRVLELMTRTHQLNTTGVLFSEGEVRDLLGEDTDVREIWVAEFDDRFGTYGTVGVAVMKTWPRPPAWTLEFLAMSCRVLGRGAERAFFRTLLDRAGDRGFTEVGALYRETGRNRMMRILYQTMGLREDEEARRAGEMTFRVRLGDLLATPPWIDIR